MNAIWFSQNGNEVLNGRFSIPTKSLYKAASDAAQIFSGKIVMVATSFAVVEVKNQRIVISKNA